MQEEIRGLPCLQWQVRCPHTVLVRPVACTFGNDLNAFDCRTRHQHEDGTFPLRFIDLDWAGRAGEAVYPPFMNHTHIKWPSGVTTNAHVLAEHDVSMAMRSYDLLVFEQKQLKLHKPRTRVAPPSNTCARAIMRADLESCRGRHMLKQAPIPSSLRQFSRLSSREVCRLL